MELMTDLFYTRLVFRKTLADYRKWRVEQGDALSNDQMIRFSDCSVDTAAAIPQARFVVNCGGRRGLDLVRFAVTIEDDGGYRLICDRDLTPLAYQVVRRQFNDDHVKKQQSLQDRLNRPVKLSELLDFALEFFRGQWNTGYLDKIWKKEPVQLGEPAPLRLTHSVSASRKFSMASSMGWASASSYVLSEGFVEYGGELDEDEDEDAVMLNRVEKILKRSCVTYDVETLAQLQAERIDRAVERLNVARGSAAVALRHVHWDWADLVAKTQNERSVDEFCKEAGIYPPTAPAKEAFRIMDLEEATACPVCLDDVKLVGSMECGHEVCLNCWKDMLTSAIQTGAPGGNELLGLKCPGVIQSASGITFCHLVVKQEVFEALLSPVYDADKQNEKEGGYGVWVGGELYSAYEKIFINSFVDDNKNVTWCPNPKACGAALLKRSNVLSAKCQTCSFVSCLECSLEAHEPASCEDASQWLEILKKKAEAEEESNGGKPKDRLVKACPNPVCKIPTEKISGCMHIVCSQCKCSWCWMCGEYGAGHTGRDPPHHVYVCNKPPDAKWSNGVDFKDDGRFQFYYERYLNHQDAEGFALKKRDEGENKAKELLRQHGNLSSNDVRFVTDAYEVLIECRTVLKWTYAYAYFMKDSVARKTFEFIQSDLEKRVEAFSKEVEENDVNYLLDRRQHILTLTSVIATYLKGTMGS